MIRATQITTSSKVVSALLLLLPSILIVLQSSSCRMIVLVDAFSSGAGGCEGGMAAVGSTHLDNSNGRPVMSGVFEDGDIQVMLDGVVITPNTPMDVPIQQDVMISVNALDVSYLGILIRLEAPSGVDTVGSLVPGANTQLANACSSPIIGITHTDSTEKTMVTGTLRFDTEVSDVILDISIVFVNNNDGSAYVYDRFNVNFRQGTEAPADVPVEPPVDIPVEPPVEVPVEPPVEPPVGLPVETPTEVPVATTLEPTVTLTVEPTVEPTVIGAPVVVGAPLQSPTIIVPTDEPTVEGPTATDEPTILVKDTASPSERKTSEPSSNDIEKTMTPSPTPFDDDFNKGMGKGKGGMMMGKKGGMMKMMMMMGNRKGGKGKGKKGADDDSEVDEKSGGRTKHFLDEYIDHHPSMTKSEHNQELHIEIMEHLPFDP